jgi:hypothetical protein
MATQIYLARVYNYRNNEHFQFHSEVKDLINEASPTKLKIQTLFNPTYIDAYRNEDVVLQRINRSAITDDIRKLDEERDSIFRGLVDSQNAAMNHYNATIARHARLLQPVFDTFGNVSRLPLNEETAAIYNLVQELLVNNEEAIGIVSLKGWIDELSKKNKEFDAAVKKRNAESAGKTDLVMKEARATLDNAYNAIVLQVNALNVVEGTAVFENFIKKLNAFITKYNNTLAQRLGRSKDSSPTEDPTPEEPALDS